MLMKHGCEWKCSSWYNNQVKWIIMCKVFYFLQEVSLVRLKVGDGRVNLAVHSSIISPEAKALAVKYPQCSDCPAKWRETSTVIVPIHSLSEWLICSWAPQNANSSTAASRSVQQVCRLVYRLHLVLKTWMKCVLHSDVFFHCHVE